MNPQQAINQAFANAEAAYRKGEFQTALKLLNEISRKIAPNPTVIHLSGLCHKELGDMEQAINLLKQADKLTPHNPEICNNLGHCLSKLGDRDAALEQYNRALSANPAFANARLNRAICNQKLGQYDAARDDFEILQKSSPTVARLWSARGSLEVEVGDFTAAAKAYEKALSINSAHPKALAGRAKVALELGEEDAIARYNQAIAANSDDMSLVIGRAYALLAQNDQHAGDDLASVLVRHPTWAEGHKALAEIRWELGDSENYTSLMEEHLAKTPDDNAIRQLLFETYSSCDDIENAYRIVCAVPDADPDKQVFSLATAIFASMLGHREEADRLFSQSDRDDKNTAIHLAKHNMRHGDIAAAEDILSGLVADNPDDILVWALLDLCWRRSGNERHHWLHGQNGLYGPQQLDLKDGEISQIADYLRQTHFGNTEPLGQSLRGGTQTKGSILKRPDHLVQKLKKAISAAVERQWDKLPQYDQKHPLLRHRLKKPVIKGSWSVRLFSKGFHVQHIHPEGLLSSACYLALPEHVQDTEAKQGWLELGRAAPDLGWHDFEPLAQIKPEPGKMALFPSTLFHGTTPFEEGERISVAFDIIT